MPIRLGLFIRAPYLHLAANCAWMLLISPGACLFPAPAHAQPRFYQHRLVHYNDEAGMPSNDVTGFAEDAKGNFWFSTQFGVVKFDGRNFRTYNTGNLTGLTSNRIFALSADSTGTIFFADENETVHTIDTSGKIESRPEYVARRNLLLSRYGYVMDIRSQVRNRQDSLRFMQPFTLHAWNNSLAHEFFVAGKNKAYFIINSRLRYWDAGQLTELAYFPDQTLRHFAVNKKLYTIDQKGDIHVFNEGRQLPVGYSMARMLSAYGDYAPFDIKKSAVFANESGAFLQYNNRIYTFREAGDTLSMSLCVDNIQLPLARGIHYSRHYDTYIIHTGTDGFYLVKNKPFTVRVKENGTAIENSFMASVEIRKQTIFTANGILFTPQGTETVFRQYHIINTLLKDRKKQVWYGRVDSLICVDSNFNYLRSYHLPDTYLTGIREDLKGEIWCITNNSLMKLEGDSLRFIYERRDEMSRTETIYFENDSIAWIGTSRGLFSCNLQTGKCDPVMEMKDKYIRHLYKATDGKIWIGTYGNGFYCYSRGRFHALPLDRNGYLSSSHCFMEDGRGFMWIPTNKGLFQVLLAELNAFMEGKTEQIYYHYYDKNDGFLTNEFNGGCDPVGLRLSDGRFSLPSMNGLVVFDPAKITPELPVGDLHIERVIADTAEADANGGLLFEAGARNLRFEVSTPYFGNIANLLIEYRIKNYDKAWKPVGADGAIEISYLPSGKYILELRKQSGFGPGNYVTLSRFFSIEPFFYETPWFRILLVLLFIAGVYWLFRARLKQLEARKKTLEGLVQTRTEELKQSVDQLENTVAELRTSEDNLYKSTLLKDKLTSVILHDIRSPVRFIDLLTNHLQHALITGKKEQLPGLAAELKKTTGHLNFFTKEFLVWLTAQQSGFRARNEYILLGELFDEMNLFFQNILEWNNNALVVETDKKMGAWSDRQLLKIILHNLIDNANKHTKNGRITLSASIRETDILITVTDTGKGIAPNMLARLQRGLSENNADFFIMENDGSLGYRIIKDFADRLGATVLMESEEGKGTRVSICLRNPPE